ncbi:MAG: hypothetical protein Kow0031_41120 [Anaerolineae bacterium]
MTTLQAMVDDFLAQKRIAVAGVSRGGNAPANIIYKKLRDSGYEVFAINPNAPEIDGAPCYPNLAAVPGGVDGVVAAAHPDVTPQLVRECADLGIPRLWIHRSFGQGSFSDEAVALGKAQNVAVIPGGCPMMFCQPVDLAHKCFRWWLSVTGSLPKTV